MACIFLSIIQASNHRHMDTLGTKFKGHGFKKKGTETNQRINKLSTTCQFGRGPCLPPTGSPPSAHGDGDARSEVVTVRIRPAPRRSPSIRAGPRAFGRGLRHRGGAVERGDSQRRVAPLPGSFFFFFFWVRHLASRIAVRRSDRIRRPRAGRRAVGHQL